MGRLLPQSVRQQLKLSVLVVRNYIHLSFNSGGQQTRDLLFSAQGSFSQSLFEGIDIQRPLKENKVEQASCPQLYILSFNSGGQQTRDLLFSAQGSFSQCLFEGIDIQRPRRRIRSNKLMSAIIYTIL